MSALSKRQLVTDDEEGRPIHFCADGVPSAAVPLAATRLAFATLEQPVVGPRPWTVSEVSVLYERVKWLGTPCDDCLAEVAEGLKATSALYEREFGR